MIFLKYYAGTVTAILVFIVFSLLMFLYTNKDLFEILVVYWCFLFAPSFSIPFILTEENNDTD